MDHLEARVWLDGPAGPPGRVAGPARELALAMDAVVLRHAAADDAGASHADVLLERIPGARRADLPGTAHLPHLERPDSVAAPVIRAVRPTA